MDTCTEWISTNSNTNDFYVIGSTFPITIFREKHRRKSLQFIHIHIGRWRKQECALKCYLERELAEMLVALFMGASYICLYMVSLSLPPPPLAPSAFFPPIFAPLASLVSLSGIKTQLRKIHGNFLKVVSIRNGMQLEVFAIVESNSPLMNYNATI